MAKRTVELPDYPAILLTPRDWNRISVLDKLVDALLAHYRLPPLPPPSGKLNLDGKDDTFTRSLACLALCLMQDFVPAFKKKPNVGAPKQEHTQQEFLFPHAHEARLVQIVRSLREMLAKRQLPSTHKAAYEELIRILRKKPAPHWRYGKLRKASAFAQAWKDIPKEVKLDPDSHFPPAPFELKSLPPLPDFELVPSGGAKAWLATEYMAASFQRSSLERLFKILPPVPSELDGSRT
jgi:hypothetical protein